MFETWKDNGTFQSYVQECRENVEQRLGKLVNIWKVNCVSQIYVKGGGMKNAEKCQIHGALQGYEQGSHNIF